MTTENLTEKMPVKAEKVSGIRVALLLLSLLGIGISVYLVYTHYAGINPVCLPGTNCEVVLTSKYAQMWGIPLSVLGLLLYVGLGIASLWLLLPRTQHKGLAAIGHYTLALSGTIFSLYLLYLEAFVIHDYCTWCLASLAVMLITLICSLANLARMGTGFRGLPEYFRGKMKGLVGW